jgi:hypothetical protein
MLHRSAWINPNLSQQKWTEPNCDFLLTRYNLAVTSQTSVSLSTGFCGFALNYRVRNSNSESIASGQTLSNTLQ